MGSPISPIVANLYMEDLEAKAIQSAQNPPSFWRRFVDDTLTIMKSSQIDNFLQHLNSLDQNIQFTKEEARSDGSMPFLDVLITPREDGSLDTTVYRKPTHTDLYLHQLQISRTGIEQGQAKIKGQEEKNTRHKH